MFARAPGAKVPTWGAGGVCYIRASGGGGGVCYIKRGMLYLKASAISDAWVCYVWQGRAIAYPVKCYV